jgi:hypothetical protein
VVIKDSDSLEIAKRTLLDILIGSDLALISQRGFKIIKERALF